ncbi:MAG TPA: hypothetical protein VGP93_01120, partial [Polyangiaceae bacterium]|nr:hypothetical protein [Polyangiaceae bacterium]
NGFHGLESRDPRGELLTRAVRWEAQAARLIELSIVRSEADSPQLLPCLLDGVQSGAAGAPERYSAFDVDVELPLGLRIAAATVKPADVLFEFEPLEAKPGQKKKPRALVHRFGMADAWFSGDLYALIRREEPKSRLEFRELEIGPHAGLFASGAEGPPLPRLFGVAPQKRLLAWACSERNSLFVVATSSKRKAPLLPEQLCVHCCGAVS